MYLNSGTTSSETGLISFFNGIAIYFIITSCLGLCALVWALWKMRRLVKSGARLSPFVVCLLLSDLLEVVLVPVLIALMFINRWSPQYIYLNSVFFLVVIAARNCGLYFHQLVALKGILTIQPQCHPCSSCVLSYPLATAISVFLFVVLFALIPMLISIYIHTEMPLILYAISIINTIATFITIILHVINIIKASSLRFFSIFVMFLPYGQYIVFFVSSFFMTSVSTMAWNLAVAFCSVSLRLVTEPILCVRVTRAELRTQSPEEQDYSLNILSVTEAGPAETSITV